MSDTTPNDGKINPDTDVSATPGHHETGPVDASAAATPAASGPVEPVGEPISYDAPVSADSVKRDTYVPASEPGTGAATLASDDAPTRVQPAAYTPPVEPVQPYVPAAAATPVNTAAPVTTAAQSPVFIQAPTQPKYKGNRGAGILIALFATVVFAALYALIALALSGIGSGSFTDTTAKFTNFIVLPIFYVPAIFFFLAFALLIAVVNRGGWWAYVLFGFLVAVVVYISYIGAALLSVQAWNFTPDEALRFISQQWLNPGAIAAAVVAREVPIWTGAWIARRGRSVTARNAAAKAEYDRVLADGPQGIRSN
ncbi:hypothetical protein QMG61_14850 [Cryobacterium sp. PH31-AA6]|uniref:hypothetical protein n=1 Tax=Cryobacterium sp. PH31-AA6 TaxID=3046205 RepID=UPI0024B9B798|nr:hypothetical protein [Cryobacterium sp. PH31-AA6]MDJ0325042.1 hypothetical protein [Cryobacterium sp. PH31-AA6]